MDVGVGVGVGIGVSLSVRCVCVNLRIGYAEWAMDGVGQAGKQGCGCVDV